MQTGDGLLVRLSPRGGSFSPAQLAGLAQAAGRFGNGLLEITARGSLQVRGLSPSTVPRFADAVAALGIEAAEGVEVRTGALAGLDAAETADPRPLADALRSAIAAAGLAARLAPKTAVTVDGGGALPLGGLAADVRLRALQGRGPAAWQVQAGSVPLGCGDAAESFSAVLGVLELLAQRGPRARGKDLSAADCVGVAARLTPVPGEGVRPAASAVPIGPFPLKDGGMAHGFAPAFGQIAAPNLAAFCAALPAGAALRPAPRRGLVVTGAPHEPLLAAATAAGLVTQADDLRLKVAACAGAPGCASAWLDTKRLAAQVAREAPELLRAVPMLHISGCAKGCAKPAGPVVSLVGTEYGAELSCEGAACDPRLAKSLRALARAAAAGPKVPA